MPAHRTLHHAERLPYVYSPVLRHPHAIRVLRLHPSRDPLAQLRCDLIDFALPETESFDQPYEAISYVWGSEDKARSIVIDKRNLAITENLHAALSQIRNRKFSRLVWVDAVCINQDNTEEKELQIELMPAIYSNACRVLVWLGNALHESEKVFEDLRIIGQTHIVPLDTDLQPIIRLLSRPWFFRVWVLQEMAAARHIDLLCGPLTISGQAFVSAVKAISETSEDVTCVTTHLIQDADFRPLHPPKVHGRYSLNICPLSELIDMYRGHDAARSHDKIFALIGMSSDDLSSSGVQTDYGIPWGRLLRKVVVHTLGSGPHVRTWNNSQVAVIQSKGCILGSVFTSDKSDRKGYQTVTAKIRDASSCRHFAGRCHGEMSFRWKLHRSATPVQDGDLICIFEGNPKPMIIRPQLDTFTVIIATICAAPYPSAHHTSSTTYTKKEDGGIDTDATVERRDWDDIVESLSFIDTIQVVWDLRPSSEQTQTQHSYDELDRHSHGQLGESHGNKVLEMAKRQWNAALAMVGVREDEADEFLRRAEENFLEATIVPHLHSPTCVCNHVPLFCAAGIGDEEIVRSILARRDVDPDLPVYRQQTALVEAAKNGHERVVQTLIESRKVDIFKGKEERWEIEPGTGVHSQNWKPWAMVQAAAHGHEGVVRLLLDTANLEIDAARSLIPKTKIQLLTAEESITTTLVADRNVLVHTSLRLAARNGHLAVVKLLTETEGFDPRMQVYALRDASQNGHEEVARLLLWRGDWKKRADGADSEVFKVMTSAARYGHKGVVRLLLEAHDWDCNELRTILHYALDREYDIRLKTLEQDPEKGWKTKRVTQVAAQERHQKVMEMLREGDWTVRHEMISALQRTLDGDYDAAERMLMGSDVGRQAERKEKERRPKGGAKYKAL